MFNLVLLNARNSIFSYDLHERVPTRFISAFENGNIPVQFVWCTKPVACFTRPSENVLDFHFSRDRIHKVTKRDSHRPVASHYFIVDILEKRFRRVAKSGVFISSSWRPSGAANKTISDDFTRTAKKNSRRNCIDRYSSIHIIREQYRRRVSPKNVNREKNKTTRYDCRAWTGRVCNRNKNVNFRNQVFRVSYESLYKQMNAF